MSCDMIESTLTLTKRTLWISRLAGMVTLICNYIPSESMYQIQMEWVSWTSSQTTHCLMHVSGSLCDPSTCRFASECLHLYPVVTVKRLRSIFSLCFCFTMSSWCWNGLKSTSYKGFYSFIWSFVYDSSLFCLPGQWWKITIHLSSFNFDLLNLNVSILL